MATCNGCNQDPCTCSERPGGIHPRAVPFGLLAGTAVFVLRRRRADLMDLAAQITFGLLGTALIAALSMAVRR